MRAVGLFAERRAGGLPHRDIAKALLVADAGEEFVDQARFADAGLADEAHQLGRAAARQVEARQHALQLRVAADQRRAEAERFEPARRARRGERPGQPMHQHAAGLAAQRDVAERLVGEGVAGQPVGERADQDLARRGQRLQPLRDVHRIARDRIGLGVAGAEAAGHDRPGVDADMEQQRQAGAGRHCSPSRAVRGDHVERGAERPLGIVLMRHRRAEQSEQRIADELVDKAAKPLDRRGQFLEQLVLQRLHDLRVELLAQRGEAAEVGEQHGDGAAVGVETGCSPSSLSMFGSSDGVREGGTMVRLGVGAGRSTAFAGAPTLAPHFGQNSKSGAQG